MDTPQSLPNTSRREFRFAELFAGLALLALGFALASPSQPGVLYTHTSTIIISFSPYARQIQFFTAIASAVSAAVYFAVGRYSIHTFNRLLSLVHLGLFAAGVYLSALAVMGLGNLPSLAHTFNGSNAGATNVTSFWPTALAASLCSAGLGCLAFAGNLSITVFTILRAKRNNP